MGSPSFERRLSTRLSARNLNHQCSLLQQSHAFEHLLQLRSERNGFRRLWHILKADFHSDFDIRYAFTAGVTYSLPGPGSNKFCPCLRRLVAGQLRLSLAGQMPAYQA